jgi:aminoglycoside phosphotransferase (APT) family kinase protein
MLDTPKPVRKGEELDPEKLRGALEPHVGKLERIEVEQFPSGHSNLTYLVRAGDRHWVLRRPPFGNVVKTAHDMGREYRILAKLHLAYPAPKPVFYCEDLSIMGAPFYVMERLAGVILRRTLPAGLTLSSEQMGDLSRVFIDRLADLHRINPVEVGLSDLGKPQGYVARQVSGWSERYQKAQTDDIPDVQKLGAWLEKNQPQEAGAALIHGDYKFDNLVLSPKISDGTLDIVGVLDWEMATLGCPLMDLGTALSYWVEASDDAAVQMLAFGPTMLPGALSRGELAARYAEKTGRAAFDPLFYFAFGLFKTTVVAQQIYARYKKGLTHDERFQHMIAAVKMLSQQALSAIARGKI